MAFSSRTFTGYSYDTINTGISNGTFTTAGTNTSITSSISSNNPSANAINVGDTISWNRSNGTLSAVYMGYYLSNGIEYPVIRYSYNMNDFQDFLLGQTSGGNFQVTPAAYDQPACYVTGTLIRTARGDVPVEDLVVGDMAVTASGRMRPITWIGSRTLDGRDRTLPHNQQPIRIRANAFGPGLPERDLRLSPGHPVLVGADADGEGGHLVPVMCLISGTSIRREPATSVTYWHVELDAHDILLAEGLAAESYYDMGSRAWFAGGDGALIDPEFVPVGEHGRCRPVAVDGPVVEAERLRIDAVFACELASHGAWNDTDRWLAP